MSPEWQRLKEALEEVRRLLESFRGRGGLRHGLSYVRVSDIVEQARCEKRLEAILGWERVVDERVKLVDELVRLVLGARRRIPESHRGILFIDAPLAALVREVPIVGRPKAIVAEGGLVKGIVYASTSKRPERLYDTDRVRAAAFCATLLYSPLPRVPNPLYFHVKARNRSELAEAIEALREQLEAGTRLPRWPGVHVIACDEAYSLEVLEPLLAYWVGAREAIARPGPWCSECPLRGVCEAAGNGV